MKTGRAVNAVIRGSGSLIRLSCRSFSGLPLHKARQKNCLDNAFRECYHY